MIGGESFTIALRGILANKLRSALTMLGILIGVGSVIVLVAVGNGSSKAVQNRIDSLGTNTITIMKTLGIIMSDERRDFSVLAFLRLQSWLSPAFPTGSYSYSHGLEWAVEAGYVHDRESLVDWLDADLRYGSGRNEDQYWSAIKPGSRKLACAPRELR